MTVLAFSYLMAKLKKLGDACIESVSDRPELNEYWTWFIPEIANDKHKVSNWRRFKCPDDLVCSIMKRLDSDLAPFEAISPGARYARYSIPYFQYACVIGWLVRNPRGPLYALTGALSDPTLVSDGLLDGNTIDDFMCNLLGDFWFDGSSEQCDSCEQAIKDMATVISHTNKKSSDWKKSPDWPESAAQYERFVREKPDRPANQREMCADLLTQMLMSALLGPRDYRDDFLLFMHPFALATDDVASRKPSKNDDYGLDLTPRLMRVAFNSESARPFEWAACMSKHVVKYEGQDVPWVKYADVDLEAFACVEFRRATKRLHRIDDNASDQGTKQPDGSLPTETHDRTLMLFFEQTEVSERHACVRKTDTDDWEVVDSGSRNGTLVAHQNGSIRVLRHEGESERLHNGDIICLAPGRADGFHPRANMPSYLFYYATEYGM